MAPRPLPTKLKGLRGTLRNDRVNQREPKPRRVRPRPPKSLPAAGQSLWRDLIAVLDDARVMTVADVTALGLLCEAWAEYRQADVEIKATGLTYRAETANGYIIRPHPTVAIRADAWRRVERMLSRFGLTPSDRTKVSERETAQGHDPAVGYFDAPPTDRFLFGKRKGA